MRRYHARQIVDEGIYFDARRLAFKSLEERGRLPGAADEVYVRIPALLILPMGLLLSLVYVIFLPLVGFLMVARLVAEGLYDLARKGAHAVAHGLHMAHCPAYAQGHGHPRSTTARTPEPRL